MEKLHPLSGLHGPRYGTALFLLCGLLFFVHLGTLGLWDPDETRYAEIAREMMETGDFVVPHLNGIPYLDKPPLYMWLVAGSFSVFGVNEYAARLPGALAALIGVFALYGLGRRMYGPNIGFWGATLLATSVLYTALAHIVLIDMVLACFIVLSLACFYRGYAQEKGRGLAYLGMYLFSAMAVLTKGPVGALVPGGIIFLFLALRREWKRFLEMRLVLGGILFMAVAVPWYGLISLREPSFARFFFVEQNLSGFFKGEVHHRFPVYMSIPMLLGAFMPWAPLLICLMLSMSWRGRLGRIKDDPRLCFLACWALVPFLLFSLSAAKLTSYFLPVLPSLALLLVRGWNGLGGAGPDRRARNVHAAGLAITLIGCAIAFIVIASHPVFRRLIQESDPTLLVLLCGAVVALMASSAVAFFLIPRGRWTVGAGAVLSAYMLAGFVVFPYLRSIEDFRCPRRMAAALRPHMREGDVVVAYHALAKGLVFYLQRPVMMVGKTSDYTLGLQLVPDPKKHVMSAEELWDMVRSNRRVFIYLLKSKAMGVPGDVRSRLSVLSENGYQLVLSNHGPSFAHD